jgi:hypothetical protein
MGKVNGGNGIYRSSVACLVMVLNIGLANGFNIAELFNVRICVSFFDGISLFSFAFFMIFIYIS